MIEHIVVDWRDLLDIGIVSFLLYQVIQLLRGSRALAVVSGLGILTFLYFLSRALGLYTLQWLLDHSGEKIRFLPGRRLWPAILCAAVFVLASSFSKVQKKLQPLISIFRFVMVSVVSVSPMTVQSGKVSRKVFMPISRPLGETAVQYREV